MIYNNDTIVLYVLLYQPKSNIGDLISAVILHYLQVPLAFHMCTSKVTRYHQITQIGSNNSSNDKIESRFLVIFYRSIVTMS